MLEILRNNDTELTASPAWSERLSGTWREALGHYVLSCLIRKNQRDPVFHPAQKIQKGQNYAKTIVKGTADIGRLSKNRKQTLFHFLYLTS